MKLIYVEKYENIESFWRSTKLELIGVANNETEAQNIIDNYNKTYDYSKVEDRRYVMHVLKNDKCVFEIKDFNNKFLK